jgi:DNA-binding Lrp family transcriptional regulator
VDKLDKMIISLLNENARKSFRGIAKDLKVSLSTVSNRIRKMEDDGIIMGYIPVINQQEVGYDLIGIINIKISQGKLLDVQRLISQDKHVVAVYDTTGDWDSIVIARFTDRPDLNKFIKNVVSIDQVERTSTQIALNVVKDEKRVVMKHI